MFPEFTTRGTFTKGVNADPVLASVTDPELPLDVQVNEHETKNAPSDTSLTSVNKTGCGVVGTSMGDTN
jgi:hypothetical protein